MRWEVNLKGSTISYTGYAENTPVTEAVFKLWQKYIQDVAPKNADVVWDHLRVELWMDSGRVILFPTPSPFRYRMEKAVCQIICPDLLNIYENLIEAEMSDENFEAALSRKEQDLAGLLSASANAVNLPEHLGRPTIKILYYGANLEKPIIEDNFKK